MTSCYLGMTDLKMTYIVFSGYVMKYFMQYRAEVAGSVDLPQDERLTLLHSNSNIKELRYLLSMVDLLSTCAEVSLSLPLLIS